MNQVNDEVSTDTGDTLSVLLVEDDPNTRELFKIFLKQRGGDYRVTTCSTAEEAMTLYGQRLYPIVFLDWLLPGMDGLDLCRWMRQRNWGALSHITVVTSRTEDEDVILVLDAGANDYIPKPLDKTQLGIRLAIAERRAKEIRRSKAAENLLNEQHQALQNLLDLTGDLFQKTGTDGRLIYTNEAWRNTLGYSDDEISKMFCQSVIHPNSSPMSADLLLRAMEGESIEGVEIPLVTRSGQIVHTKAHISRLVEGDKVVGTQTLYRNVTAERTLEYNQRALGAVIQAVLASAPASSLYPTLTQALSAESGFPVAAIAHYNSDEKSITLEGLYGVVPESTDQTSFPIANTVWATVMATGKPVWAPDTSWRATDMPPFPNRADIKSFVCAPIIVGGKVYGAFALADTKTRQDVADPLLLLESIAENLALKIEADLRH